MLAELARAVTSVSAIDSERKVPLLHRTHWPSPFPFSEPWNRPRELLPPSTQRFEGAFFNEWTFMKLSFQLTILSSAVVFRLFLVSLECNTSGARVCIATRL